MATTFLTAALAYHELGYHVIPAAPRQKRPKVPWKDFQTTMPTTEQIQSWWCDTPDANIALVLGRGQFAVDLDGGDEAEALLADAGIALPPDAPRSRTGSGYHVFLSAYHPVPDRIALLSRDGGRPQVDIRGIGIVIAPPSIHPNGSTYEWVTPLTRAPPHAPLPLMDLIATAPSVASSGPDASSQSHTQFWVADALRGVGEGQRDQTCTRLAGYLLKKGLDTQTVTAILVESFGNACTPPFGQKDVEKCVQSIARRESTTGDLTRNVQAVHISDALSALQQSIADGPTPTVPTPFPTLNHFLNGGVRAR